MVSALLSGTASAQFLTSSMGPGGVLTFSRAPQGVPPAVVGLPYSAEQVREIVTAGADGTDSRREPSTVKLARLADGTYLMVYVTGIPE